MIYKKFSRTIDSTVNGQIVMMRVEGNIEGNLIPIILYQFMKQMENSSDQYQFTSIEQVFSNPEDTEKAMLVRDLQFFEIEPFQVDIIIRDHFLKQNAQQENETSEIIRTNQARLNS